MLKKKIEKLISLIENTEIEEIEVSSFWGAQKIKLSKSKKRQEVVSSSNEKDTTSLEVPEPIISNIDSNAIIAEQENAQLSSIEEDGSSTDENYEDETKFRIVKSPLVGTFYSSPKPEDPAFVSIGDNIGKGNIVCIVEAMKIFNEIESDFSGELVHIYVQDGTPVEYGQELFALRIKDV